MPASSRRLPVAALAIASTAWFGACEVNLNSEGLTARETKTFKVNGQPEVTFETFDGAIEIQSWDRSEVEVQVEKRAMEQSLIDEIKVAAEQQGNRIVLRVTGPSRTEFRGVQVGFHVSPTARLRIALPRASTLQARTDDGSIRVDDLSGRIVLRSGDGSVTASRISGEVEVRTGDGSIQLENASGKLDLDTEDGSIVLSAARPSVLRAKTGDGAIRVQLDPDTTMADNWDLTTSDGSVTISLTDSFDAELDAETRDGAVRVNHPSLVDDRRDSSERERRSLRARVGEGGRLLRIRTGDGSIRIDR